MATEQKAFKVGNDGWEGTEQKKIQGLEEFRASAK
jgi:hypothetical protein